MKRVNILFKLEMNFSDHTFPSCCRCACVLRLRLQPLCVLSSHDVCNEPSRRGPQPWECRHCWVWSLLGDLRPGTAPGLHRVLPLPSDGAATGDGFSAGPPVK